MRKRKRRRRLFIKTFLITIAFFSVLIFAGWLTLKSAVKPPTIAQEDGNTTTGNETDLEQAAYHLPDEEHEDGQIGDDSPAPEGFTPEDRKPLFYTFLVFGLDEGVNTDTIMVAAYDGTNHKAYVVGFPRDSKVNVKRSIKKINAAYPAGTLHGGGKDGGIDQLKRELKTLIGFIPDYYVCIDFKAFKQIVDTLGGVEVDVPINMLYDDPYQDLHINISKGVQTLTGKEALHFARYRKGNNGVNTITDYQRIENQQAVIKAVLDKLLKPANILKLPEFINIFNENVYTDIKLEEMAWFAKELNNVTGSDALETYTLPTTGTSGPPSYYELPDEAAIVTLINQTINPYVKDIEAKDLDIIN